MILTDNDIINKFHGSRMTQEQRNDVIEMAKDFDNEWDFLGVLDWYISNTFGYVEPEYFISGNYPFGAKPR